MKYKKIPVDMVFDRSVSWIGDWSDKETSVLDDLSYYLLLDNYIKTKGRVRFSNQERMIKRHTENKRNFSSYYNKAEILLRKSKIKKVKDKLKK